MAVFCVFPLLCCFNPFTVDPVKALYFATERQSARMSKLKNGGLDQYGAGPFEQQQLGTDGVEGVNANLFMDTRKASD